MFSLFFWWNCFYVISLDVWFVKLWLDWWEWIWQFSSVCVTHHICFLSFQIENEMKGGIGGTRSEVGHMFSLPFGCNFSDITPLSRGGNGSLKISWYRFSSSGCDGESSFFWLIIFQDFKSHFFLLICFPPQFTNLFPKGKLKYISPKIFVDKLKRMYYSLISMSKIPIEI